MPLPKLNNTPKYEIIIPSDGNKTTYRPFLVKEEKILMIAMESEDKNHMLSSIMDTLEACVDNINRETLTSFDIEYLFTKIRTKSVGESATVQYKCKSCEHMHPLKINLDHVKLTESKNKSNKIDLGNSIFLEMKYPYYKDIITQKEDASPTEQMFSMLRICMNKIYTDDEIINLNESKPSEIDEFIESMNSKQLQQLTEFVESMPKLQFKSKFNCESCDTENEAVVEGFENFFG